jgi:hypothetical protein
MTQNGTGLLRPRYFDRQQLRAADLTAGQDYLRERLRRHNRFLHGFGVVCGAEIIAAGTEENPWLVSIGEGYVVTPGGDEVYLPPLPAYDIREGVEACLGATLPCPDPTDPGDSSEDGELRIIRASINPPGKDLRTEYNEEWVDLMLLEDTNLNGYEVEHTINPGTPDEALERYYLFKNNLILPAGAILRIHSGAAADDPVPSPGVVHWYVADPGEVGNWRLNNQGDTLRVLNPDGEVVDTQSFLPVSYYPVSAETVYLVACPGEEETCPLPAVPVACQPPGGAYEFGRVCETYKLQIRCDLPPSHQGRLSCDDLEAIVCGNQHPPFPGMPVAGDNCAVLATIHILDDEITVIIDDMTDRRLLLSESLLFNYLQCRCDELPFLSPGQITSSVMAINLERIANELNVNLEDLDLVAAAEHDLTDIYNVGPKRKQSFKEAGVQNIIIVATMPVEEIMRIAEVSESQAEIIQASARQLMLQT